jgi:hypothetical protein
MPDSQLIVDGQEEATPRRRLSAWARMGLVASGATVALASFAGVAAASDVDVDFDLDTVLGDELTLAQAGQISALFGGSPSAAQVNAMTTSQLLQTAIDRRLSAAQFAALTETLDDLLDDDDTFASSVSAATTVDVNSLDVSVSLDDVVGAQISDAQAQQIASLFTTNPPTPAEVRGMTVEALLNRAIQAGLSAGNTVALLDVLDEATVNDDAATVSAATTGTAGTVSPDTVSPATVSPATASVSTVSPATVSPATVRSVESPDSPDSPDSPASPASVDSPDSPDSPDSVDSDRSGESGGSGRS